MSQRARLAAVGSKGQPQRARPSASASKAGGSLLRRFECAATLLTEAATFAAPVDRLLANLFTSERQWGSQDRRHIADMLYFVLRHWRSLEVSVAADLYALDQLHLTPRQRLIAALTLPRSRYAYDLALTETVAAFTELIPSLSAPDQAFAAICRRASWPLQALASDAASLDLPDWLFDRLAALDEAALDDLAALGQQLACSAALDIRVNTLKLSCDEALAALNKQGIACEPCPHAPYGLRLGEHPGLYATPLFQQGAIEVQDEGSQLLALLVAPKRGEAVVDFCAGAGGKTLALGQIMNNQGRLYALDISAKRLAKMKPRLARSGLSNVHPMVIAASGDKHLKRWQGKIDRVLVDAPCSGVGTLRRNPDLKWRRQPADLAELTQKQADLLARAARLVKPGGRLVYATCSLLPEENQVVADAFLSAGDFVAVDAVATLNPRLRRPLDNASLGPYLQLWPHRHGCDGFFAAVFERQR